MGQSYFFGKSNKGLVLGALTCLTLACGGESGGGNSSTEAAGASGSTGAESAAGAGNETCSTGDEGCDCYGNDTCNGSLSCESGVCIDSGEEGIGGSGPNTGGAGGSSGGSTTTGAGGMTGGAASGGAASGGAEAAGTGGADSGGTAGSESGGSGSTGAGGDGGTGDTAGTSGGGGEGGAVECADGFLDCNGFSIDGCEDHVAVDPKHCGTCDTVCPSGALCIDSTCSGVPEAELVLDEDVYHGRHAAIAVEPDGVPYVSWTRRDYPKQQYLRVDTLSAPDRWTNFAYYGSPDFQGSGISALAFNADGELCTAGDMQNGLFWACGEGVDNREYLAETFTVDSSSGIDFVMDPADDPLVAVTGSGGLHFSWPTWTDIDAQGKGWVSLAQATTGQIHIAYLATENSIPRHAVWDGESWTTDDVSATDDATICGALALDPDGNPQILYYDSTAQELKLASRADAGWTSEIVVSAADIDGCAFAYDSRGRRHVVYHGEEPVLNVMTTYHGIENGFGWSTATSADGRGVSGYGSSFGMALDASDRAHVAFATGTTVVYVYFP